MVSGKNFDTGNTGGDSATVYVYVAPRVRLSKETRLYIFVTMMAEVGGYVGLLLGVSLFQLARWATDAIDRHIKNTDPDKVNKMYSK